ncbi:MAG: glutathione S-transferase N-terminal domain-containing protein, partial [Alphaproteobacteria bacterium]|nr:glutathione S-transferase N-terminal domain-containing protein [Alphaproteobacteria bacterium]
MKPVLYSFRRCPYAMRARLAVASAGVEVELREILLRDKPAAFLAASPSATVPCLVTDSGVIDESLDVMLWALTQNDPEGWLQMPEAGHDWITRADGPFKQALDRTKYANRYP